MVKSRYLLCSLFFKRLQKQNDMYLLGYDIGSSSIKAALVEAHSNKVVAVVQYPATEMDEMDIVARPIRFGVQ